MNMKTAGIGAVGEDSAQNLYQELRDRCSDKPVQEGYDRLDAQDDFLLELCQELLSYRERLEEQTSCLRERVNVIEHKMGMGERNEKSAERV